MPPDINAQIRDQVAKELLSGSTRDEIAKNMELAPELLAILSMNGKKDVTAKIMIR